MHYCTPNFDAEFEKSDKFSVASIPNPSFSFLILHDYSQTNLESQSLLCSVQKTPLKLQILGSHWCDYRLTLGFIMHCSMLTNSVHRANRVSNDWIKPDSSVHKWTVDSIMISYTRLFKRGKSLQLLYNGDYRFQLHKKIERLSFTVSLATYYHFSVSPAISKPFECQVLN